jgi:hypothetical protein
MEKKKRERERDARACAKQKKSQRRTAAFVRSLRAARDPVSPRSSVARVVDARFSAGGSDSPGAGDRTSATPRSRARGEF